MNRWIAFFIFCGLFFWGIFIYHLVEKTPKSNTVVETTVSTSTSIDDLSRLTAKQNLPLEKLKNPFAIPQAFRPSTKTIKGPVIESEKKIDVVPKPAITLDAILPGDRPVAILRHKGSTSIVRVGQEIWSVKIASISAETVVIEYAGGLLELKK